MRRDAKNRATSQPGRLCLSWMPDGTLMLAETNAARVRSSDTTLTKLNQVRLAPRAPGGRLSIVYPRALEAAFTLRGAAFVLGRHADRRHADGQIPHPTVSRVHLAIAWNAEAGAYTARDLGSHNGSALDGVPLGSEPRPLGDGSVLRLGDVLLVFEAGAAPGAPDEIEPREVGDAIPGRAAGMQALRTAIVRAAADQAPVLILGETGSGKERVARELHRLSGRSGPLVSIN